MLCLQPGVLTTPSHVTTENASPKGTQSATLSQTVQMAPMRLFVVNNAKKKNLKILKA